VTQSRFATTHWSVVLAAATRDSPTAHDAQAKLCATYWYPLYAYARRQGRSSHEAEDLIQAFFALVLEKEYLQGTAPEKGRFRTFLLVCLKRFMAKEWQRTRAQKRGGGISIMPMDFRAADERYRLEPAHVTTPERIYERRWALTVLESALTQLADEMREAGKERVFDTLKIYLATDRTAGTYAEAAEALKTSEGAVKVAVHRLRTRYAQLVREEVAGTLADPEQVDDEVRHLFEALAE